MTNNFDHTRQQALIKRLLGEFTAPSLQPVDPPSKALTYTTIEVKPATSQKHIKNAKSRDKAKLAKKARAKQRKVK